MEKHAAEIKEEQRKKQLAEMRKGMHWNLPKKEVMPAKKEPGTVLMWDNYWNRQKHIAKKSSESQNYHDIKEPSAPIKAPPKKIETWWDKYQKDMAKRIAQQKREATIEQKKREEKKRQLEIQRETEKKLRERETKEKEEQRKRHERLEEKKREEERLRLRQQKALEETRRKEELKKEIANSWWEKHKRAVARSKQPLFAAEWEKGGEKQKKSLRSGWETKYKNYVGHEQSEIKKIEQQRKEEKRIRAVEREKIRSVQERIRRIEEITKKKLKALK
jgi:hypothetical protein